MRWLHREEPSGPTAVGTGDIVLEENNEGLTLPFSMPPFLDPPKPRRDPLYIAAGAGGTLFAVLIILLARGCTSQPKEAAAVRPTAAKSERTALGHIYAEGRLVPRPGAEVTLSSETGGMLVKLAAGEGDHVEKGALLAAFASEEARAALAEARGRFNEAWAEARYQAAELRRHLALRSDGAETASTLDRAQRDERAARARLQTAAAEVSRLEAHLRQLTITAPFAGTVTARFASEGEALPPDAKLLTLTNLDALRMEAEVDEYDAGRLTVGAPVAIRAEGFGDRRWHGVVEEIPPLVQGRRLKPVDPGRPTDIRVLLVKIALTEPTPLKLGQRAEVEIGENPSVASGR